MLNFTCLASFSIKKCNLRSNEYENEKTSRIITNAFLINDVFGFRCDSGCRRDRDCACIYGFEWTKDSMAVYVDGKLNCKWLLTPENLASYGLDPDATGFDTTMNIILGNNLYNRNSILKLDDVIEDNPDSLPSEFDIDYIRLYQKNDGLSELYLNG